MISVIGKQMIFPNEEQTFIFLDEESTSRTFILNRYEADRVDISNLTFRLDVEYKRGQKDSLLLVKAVQEKQILLHWDIKKEDLKENGTVFAALRGFDADGVLRWTSAKTPIFVENVIDTPGSWEGGLTELEQMEQRISTVLDSEAGRKEAETARAEAETERIAAEEQRGTAFAAAMQAAAEATEKALNAEGPQGPRGEPGRDGYTPVKGVDYFDGVDGKDGYTPVKGVDYFDGIDGKNGRDGIDGKDGYTPVKGVDYFDGVDGKDGYTPKKDVDYFDGERGEKGEPGRGLDIKRNFATEDALRAAISAPTGGDTYSVGTAAPFDIYIYDEGEQDWVNHGPLQGAKGDKGDPFTYADFTAEQLAALKGEPGRDGYTPQKGVDYFDGEKGDPFTYADFTAEQLAALKGEPGRDGRDGVDGAAGKDGYTPQKGVDYFDGEKGDPFTYADFTAEQLAALKGEPGKDGRDGVDGADGKSAFAAAQEAGYKGTEAELANALNDLPGHISNNDIHVTAQEKESWDGKAEGNHSHTPHSIGAASNPNLLDNWYFGNPVNQRGQMQYTGIGYGIDRWHSGINPLTVTIHSGYTTIYKKSSGGYFNQSIEMDLRGKQVTCSVLFRNGELYQNTFVLTEYDTFLKTIGDAHMYGGFDTSTNKTVFGFYFNTDAETSLDIVAVNMELGAVQTLARQENGVWVLNDAPTDNALELSKCQRCFQTFATQSLRPTDALDFRPVMRTTPALGTITVNGKTLYTASADM